MAGPARPNIQVLLEILLYKSHVNAWISDALAPQLTPLLLLMILTAPYGYDSRQLEIR